MGYEQRLDLAFVPLMLRLYNDWINSNRVVFPYPGGRLNQPTWVLDYFDVFASVDELSRLENERPSPEGLPTREEAFGRG